MITASLLLLPLLLAGPPGDEVAWPGFRGPNGTGLGPAGSVPEVLDPAENLQWRTEIPSGYSSPIVVGERIFLTAAQGQELLTLCFDRTTGKERWRRGIQFSGRRPGANSPAAPTCASDGKLVISFFNDFGLFAYDLEGEEAWAVKMGPFAIPHGMASSPVLHGDLVILQIDQDSGSYLVAFGKDDGVKRWRIDRPGFTHSYATPAIWAPADGPAQVIVSGSFKICSYSIEDQELLWWVDGSAFMTKSVPVVVGDRCFVSAFAYASTDAGLPKITQTFAQALEQRDADGDGKISKEEFDDETLKMAWFVFDLDDDGAFDERDWAYLTASNRPTGGLFSIRLGGSGNVTESHVQWVYDGRRGLPDATSPVVVGNTVFLVKSGALLTAFDAETGAVVKMDRVGKPDNYFASPVAADGRMITASLAGHLAVVSAERHWKVLSNVDLGEEIWATPALVPGQVIVRTQKALYSFAVPAE